MNLFSRKQGVSFSGTVLVARSLDFMGPFSRSPNGAYAIAWDQATGVFVLSKDKAVKLSGHVRNPSHGVVCDCGVFALASPGQGSTRYETLRVFDQAGNALLTKRFPLNVYALGLSSSGSHVACQLMDGDVVLVELAGETVVWKVAANPTGNLRLLAEGLAIDTKNSWVSLDLGDGGNPRISFSGEHLDTEEMRADFLRSAREAPNGLALFYLVRERLDQVGETISPDAAKEVLALLDESQQLGFKGYPDFEAKVHRARGEAYEAMGQPLGALQQYGIALRMDPKVGVKRRADALEKRLNQAESTQNGLK